MLKPDELTAALNDGLRAAQPPCGAFCASGAHIDDARYAVYHNSTGPRSTDCQIVYAKPVLNLSREQLTAKLQQWVERLHVGVKLDLNEVKA
jgi:hypothetical protein